MIPGLVSLSLISLASLVGVAKAGPFSPSPLSERAALSCYPLELKQLQTLRAWPKLVQYAQDTYGPKGEPHVNVEEHPEYGRANACMNEAAVKISYATQPSCSSLNNTVKGTVDGTNQKVKFLQRTGMEQQGSWTVTDSATIGVSMSFNVGFSVEGLFDAGLETTVSAEVTNERSSSFSTTSSNVLETTVEFENQSGDQCAMTLETKTCSAIGQGRVPVVAEGVVWFFYPERRAPADDPEHSKHYHWGINIADVLTQEERTSYADIKGPIRGTYQASYSTSCQDTNSTSPVTLAII
ncbi:hypothetical protein EST38_g4698 [Candolleomyces aberdarensis]|uniref:Uncharacterized protein n=1 Tax=Candolleomyces aberdarensis TaxID=2316362 RepID=A0A4Q2DMB6_9AGAR|nr:hypothetical protein EST38_g4698 [Candolleomyces aberdarensis]